MPIFRETVYFQGDKQVEKTDVIHSYLFGQTVVPISGTEFICCLNLGYVGMHKIRVNFIKEDEK